MMDVYIYHFGRERQHFWAMAHTMQRAANAIAREHGVSRAKKIARGVYQAGERVQIVIRKATSAEILKIRP